AQCLWALLPAPLLWGASFPLALAAIAPGAQDPGRLVGELYAANTIGAIAGATLFSMVLIPAFGTQQSQRELIGLSLIAGLMVLEPAARSVAGKAWLTAATAVAAALIWSVAPVPWMVFGYGRQVSTTTGKSELLYLGEGMSSSIAISKYLDDGARFFHV